MDDKFKDFPFQRYLKSLYDDFYPLKVGQVATYIPELAKANPDNFAISLVTVDGHLKKIGCTDTEFTIQSISKPFVYGLALEDLGVSRVLDKINSEPSGDAFNSISLEPETGRPLNPMINAGAIATTSCIVGKNLKERLKRILTSLSTYAGRSLAVDDHVYRSEKKTGHRNHAIAYMLRNFNIIESRLEMSLDLYFKQCSILLNCSDLATMAATLANDGINPVTGIRAIKKEFVPLILSVMSLCGMYDFSGRWIYRIGLPAKSGVGGGIIAVLPGQFGLAVYSPPLDIRGNSVRGIEVCRRLSEDFSLHLLGGNKIAYSAIRSHYSLKQMRSKRLRSLRDSYLLESVGDKTQIFELQGEMRFSAAEAVVRHIYEVALESHYVVIDFKRVPYIDAGAYKLLKILIEQIKKLKKSRLVISGVMPILATTFHKNFKKHEGKNFYDLDHALEWVENKITRPQSINKSIPFKHNELCQMMSKKQLSMLEKNTKILKFKMGDTIIKTGEIADKVYCLISGEVSINLHPKDGSQIKRIATFSAGMCFGELALIEQSTRTADVVADSSVECYVLDVDTLNQLYLVDINLKVILLENLSKKLSKNLRQSNLEVITLSNS